MNYPLITDKDDLENFCAEAESVPAVGVDTEFVWSNTYYAKLGLIQIGWDKEHAALIDPLAITDKSPIVHLLENPAVVKVFHEAASDLPILHRWCGMVPKNVADTRYEAGFCGRTAQLSLAKLLAQMLGVVLPKTETRTNWLQRPLTDAQLQYAGDDVALLPALYQVLRQEVAECGNWDCFSEEMKIYEASEYYVEMPADECWKRVARPGYLKFAMQDYAVLQQLAAWRENTARKADIPRVRVMKDEWLAQAAVKHPYSLDEVLRLQGMWASNAKRYGDEMGKVVKAAMLLPKDQWPEVFHPELDQRLIRQASERFSTLIAKRASQRKIDPVLVGSRRECDSIAAHALKAKGVKSSPLMNGWKYQLLSPVIDDICSSLAHKKIKR